MAKAYRAKQDVSFPRVLAVSGEGENRVEAAEGTNYPAGSVVPHDTLPDFLKERVNDGQLDDVLEPLSDEEAEDAQGYTGEPEHGIFVAEHEAEAHALEVAGHQVVPKEQVLEALSAGEQHSDEYMRAVKDAGLDHRPNQEFLAQPRERVPDEVLYGAQTPAGGPYNRGPAEGGGAEENEGEENQNLRQRPPTTETPEGEVEPPSEAGTPGPEAQGRPADLSAQGQEG